LRRRVLMIQPSLQPPGGGNGVAAWMLQALQDQHELGVLTWTPLDLDAVNWFYGTSVNGSRVHLMTVNALARWIPDRLPFSLALLRSAILLRAAKQLSADWDILLTVNNEANFGRPGIQYVHYPAYLRPRPLEDARWYHGPPLALNSYYRFADWLSDMSAEGIRQNLTLVNSDWTGRLVRERHGIEPMTLYPPVHSRFVDMPWAQRINGFLSLGRISPEKQIHRVIDILALVRKRRPDVSLHLVGTLGQGSYGGEIAKRVDSEGAWLSRDNNLSRAELLDLIPTYRYGIHGMLEEHFGMAPAELVSAGCIVFLPNGGGQVEIVGREPRLVYTDVKEAAESILYVLEHPEEQSALRRRLAERKAAFATERFIQTVRELIEGFPAPTARP